MEEALLRLIGIVEDRAPELWALAVQQAQVEAHVCLVTAQICAVIVALAIVAIVVAWWLETRDSLFCGPTVSVIGGLVIIFAGVFGITEYIRMIRWFTIPEYGAIRILLQMVGQ